MIKEDIKAGHQEPAPKVNKKKLSLRKCNYIRNWIKFPILEEILLRRFGYRYLEEVPEDLYSEIRVSLFSLRKRLTHDRRKWENDPKNKYISRHKPVYENNERIF